MKKVHRAKEANLFQKEFRLFLADKYENGKLKLPELLAILEIFSGIENNREFPSLIEIFSKSFPVLKDFLKKQHIK